MDDEAGSPMDPIAATATLAAATNVGLGALFQKPTDSLLQRLVTRLLRTRRRKTEADPAHLLEAVAVVIYNPDTAQLSPVMPPPGSGLRWREFVQTMADTYDVRFE